MQLVVDVNARDPVRFHNLRLLALDGNEGLLPPAPPEVDNELFSFCEVELHLVVFWPADEALHHTSALLIALADTADNRGVFGELLKVTFAGVDGKEER